MFQDRFLLPSAPPVECRVIDFATGWQKLFISGTPREATGPVSLGNPDEVSIISLAQMIIELTGSRSHARMTAAQDDDPERRRPDIAAAQQPLHHTSLKQRLQKTIAYFDEMLSEQASLAQI